MSTIVPEDVSAQVVDPPDQLTFVFQDEPGEELRPRLTPGEIPAVCKRVDAVGEQDLEITPVLLSLNSRIFFEGRLYLYQEIFHQTLIC